MSINNLVDEFDVLPDWVRPHEQEMNDVFYEPTNTSETITVLDPKTGDLISDTLPAYNVSNRAIWKQLVASYPAELQHFLTPPASSWQERVPDTGLPIEQFGITPEHPVTETYTHFVDELSLLYQDKDGAQYDDVLQSALEWVRSRMNTGN